MTEWILFTVFLLTWPVNAIVMIVFVKLLGEYDNWKNAKEGQQVIPLILFVYSPISVWFVIPIILWEYFFDRDKYKTKEE